MQAIMEGDEYVDEYNIDRQQRGLLHVHIQLMRNFEMLYMRHGSISEQVHWNDLNGAHVVPFSPYLLVRHRYHDQEEAAVRWKSYNYIAQYVFMQQLHRLAMLCNDHCRMAQRRAI